MTFEEILTKYESHELLIPQFNSNAQIDIDKFIKCEIEDLKLLSEGKEVKPQLQEGDLNCANYYTLELVYQLVADDIPDCSDFAQIWAQLLINYINNFYPNKMDNNVSGLINLLQLKNNMARLIALSREIIFRKTEDSYTNVSSTFLETFINNKNAD